MSKTMEIGPYSAYAIAVKYGYTGSEEQWVKEQEANRIASEQARKDANTAAVRAENAQKATEEVRTDALSRISLAKTDALKALDAKQTSATSAVESAQGKALDAVTNAKNTGVTAVTDAQNTATQAVGTVKANAIQQMEAAKTDALKALDAKQTSATSAVESAQGKALDAVTNAKNTATQAVQTEQASATTAVKKAGAEVLASIPEDYQTTVQKVEELDAQKAETDEAISAVKARQNVLVGTETGNPIAVDDAFSAPLCGLTVYGKSTQDGTPSPDNPVPIVSVGDSGTVAVKVTGKNLLNISKNTTLNAYGLTWTFADGLVTISGTVPENKAYPRINLSELNGKLTLPAGRYKIIVLKHGEVDSAFLPKLLSPKFNNPTGTDVYLSSNKISTLESNYTFDQLILSKPLSGTAVDAAYEIMVVNVDTIGTDPTTYSPYREQLLTLPTPNGLPGIPVTSGGNYTDQSGQQWICDEVDLERGVKVQRVKAVDLSTCKITGVTNLTATKRLSIKLSLAGRDYKVNALCNRLPYKTSFSNDDLHFYVDKSNVFVFISLDDKNPGKGEYFLSYALATPIETPLSPAEIAAFLALTTYGPDTVVQAGDGAGVKMDYQRDVNIAIKRIEDAVASMT